MKTSNKTVSEDERIINSQIQTDRSTSLEEILNYEKNRYIRKGYGLIFAIIACLTWFFIIPNLSIYFWPKKIENEGMFYFITCYVNHEFWFIFTNIIMCIIYKLDHPFFERYKVHDKAWPWKKNLEEWHKTLKETIIMIFINHVIILPFVLLPNYISNESISRTDYNSLPSCLEVLLHTIFFMIVEDSSFYWIHRLLHMDFIYPHIHKVHHKFVNTVSIGAEYAHPIEYVFGNVLPTSLGALLLGKKAHLFTYLMWITLRIAETTDGHCGYELSWSPFRLLPMSAGSEFHNYHHLAFKGNYGSFFTIWDNLCNTVHDRYLIFIEKKKELYNKIQLERSLNDNTAAKKGESKSN